MLSRLTYDRVRWVGNNCNGCLGHFTFQFLVKNLHLKNYKCFYNSGSKDRCGLRSAQLCQISSPQKFEFVIFRFKRRLYKKRNLHLKGIFQIHNIIDCSDNRGTSYKGFYNQVTPMLNPQNSIN